MKFTRNSLLLAVILSACRAGSQSPTQAADANNTAVAVANLACLAASTPLAVTPERNHLPAVNACPSGCDTPAPRQLRRLTVAELNNTLRTLFNDTGAPQVSGIFSSDPEIYAFQNVASSLLITDLGVQQVRTMAEAAGDYAAANAAALWPSCQSTAAACESSFIGGFGQRALRAPLDAASAADYLALMQTAPSFAAGAGWVVTAMLMSPDFMFRQELGVAAGGGVYNLTPYEVASEISYLTVGSMPDAMLFTAASNGTIMDANMRLLHMGRLMQDPRAHGVMEQFFLQWLGLADLPNLTRSQGGTALDAATVVNMLQESTQTIDNVLFTHNGSFTDLHATSYSYMNASLAQFYGMSTIGSGFTQVDLTGKRDPGILNQGGVISAASEVNLPSPVLRGRLLREHILCQTLPPPPPGVPAVNGVPAGSTTRDVFVAHITNPTCASCHVLMDPMAFAQGAYDTLGRRFASGLENGQKIDTSGQINGLIGGATVTLQNAADLAAFIAGSPQAKACLARNWAMYGLGNVSWLQDSCTFTALDKSAAKSGYNLQQTLAALTQVTSFTQRVQDN